VNTRPTEPVADSDPDATARLPEVDFAPPAEEESESATSTDVLPLPAIPVGTTELAERLREVEQRLRDKEARERELEMLLDEAGERHTALESGLAAAQSLQAELEAQLAQARAHAREQTEIAARAQAAVGRHQSGDLQELRARCERQLEALTTWQGFRAVSDAQLAEADARNVRLESQLAALRNAPPAQGDADGSALRDELAALKAALLAAQEQQQQAEQRTEAAIARTRQLEEEIHASVVMFGDARQDTGRSACADVSTGVQEQMSPGEAPLRVLVRHEGSGEVIYPIGRRTTIGRTPDNDIQVDAHNVSRHHAVLLSSADHCLVEDLNSTNGVLVNGQRVMRQVLNEGDIVTIGKTEFRFQQRT
jgi:hypothetical protein